MKEKEVKFEILKGQIFNKIEVKHNAIYFYQNDYHKYSLFHEDMCCEEVILEDINGDINDLLDLEILLAEESSNTKDAPLTDEDYNNQYFSSTWTFYKLATIKGYVDIRWYGKSNGCYSEQAQLYEYEGDK
jgi:hypothetical protein